MSTLLEPGTHPVPNLADLAELDKALEQRFAEKMEVNHALDRTLVSYQANKSEIGHRWFKYREGFSADLIRYVLDTVRFTAGPILDPFAGSGTTLFISSERGLDSIGIELLPSSAEVIEVRHSALSGDRAGLARALREFAHTKAWEAAGPIDPFPHVRITTGAFDAETEGLLGRYSHLARSQPDKVVARLLLFASMCVLEDVSYTRKDGQYLRWDYRAPRKLMGKTFDKGRIRGFTEAVTSKLEQIARDLLGEEPSDSLFCDPDQLSNTGKINVAHGSCLDVLPQLSPRSLGGLITSPPYCNRYDYTRTYALELAQLGVGEEGLKGLRQAMLTCTVENREKIDLGAKFGREVYDAATTAFESQALLNGILAYLESCRLAGTLNNSGIVRMVKNYFFELALLIFSSAEALQQGAPFVMVNDNVRYEGAHVPVDLILSDFAEKAGFDVEHIWVLPKGKGNSSQQMGVHGRREVRKCVYVWRKSA